ncbi:hypothetical protein BASA81_000383 [Batrachochytrium salamandrivorans]|nr:hypothetical protein BASA81_000383 [Batrachochytrium salamandrivorans]
MLVTIMYQFVGRTRASIVGVAAVTTQLPAALEYYSSVDCAFDTILWKFGLNVDSTEMQEAYFDRAASVRIVGAGRVDFFHHNEFVSALFPGDGCVRMFRYPAITTAKLFPTIEQVTQQIPQEALFMQRRELLSDGGIEDWELENKPAKYRVVFSAQSSEYFGYQMYANKLAFMQSQKGVDCTWTRLLTCQHPDDLSLDPRFPTFTAPAHPYARRYSPINKPDVIEKWFQSPLDAPREEVIVVIDPDSWLLKPLLDDYVSKVVRGQAIGQAAYYAGSTLPQTLWHELCENNCHLPIDLVGVPYIVHRSDLEAIAPIWKHYVLKIKYLLEQTTPGWEAFAQRYAGLDVNWASEMYAYNMASTHLGIRHQVVYDLQVRDVEGTRTWKQNENKASVHVGRAWFPANSPEAKPYLHTEGRGFSYYGDQVWCKCNFTASTIKPWPLPAGVDFQSYHTLRLLHESEVQFGSVPENETWRHKQGQLKHAYKWTHP